MVALTRTYDPAEGPIINVLISGQGDKPTQSFPLLLDTGADGSSISSDVISSLKLTPIGRRSTFASGGSQGRMSTFIVDIGIQFDDGYWQLEDLVVAEFLYMKPSIRGLLGRDILCQGDFTMSSDHNFSFELPG